LTLTHMLPILTEIASLSLGLAVVVITLYFVARVIIAGIDLLRQAHNKSGYYQDSVMERLTDVIERNTRATQDLQIMLGARNSLVKEAINRSTAVIIYKLNNIAFGIELLMDDDKRELWNRRQSMDDEEWYALLFKTEEPPPPSDRDSMGGTDS
jgi:hypothetical protein